MTVQALDDAQAQAEWDRLDGEDLDVPGQSLGQTLMTDAPVGLEVDAPKDNDFPADDKPEQSAVTAADTASPSPSKDPAAPPPAAEPVKDPIAVLQESIAALQAQMQTEMRRVHGTIGGIQGQIKGMAQVKAEAAVARAASEQGGPTKQEIVQAQKSIKEWETLKEDFPDWAAGVEKYVAAQVAAAQPAPAPAPATVDVAAVVRQELQQYRAQEQANRSIEQTIEQAHPNWVATVNSPEFTAWQTSQSQGVQALAQSDDAGDAITLLNLYHMAHPKPAAAADATAPAGKSGAEVIAQRKERLAAAASPTKPVDTGPRNAIAFDDMTDEQQWAYLDELDRRKEARARA